MDVAKLKQTVNSLKPGLIGSIFFYLIPIRRKVVVSNLNIAFGKHLNPDEIKHLAKAFYKHIYLVLTENLFLSWLSEKRIKNKVEVQGMENLMEAAKKNNGVLLLTGHFGNWELGPMAGILHYPHFKGRLHILRRQLVNKTIERILFRRFYQMGLDVIPKKRSLGRVMDALSKNDTVAFIMDQFAKPGKEGVLIPFFSKDAGTFKSLAMVARSSEAPVVPFVIWRSSPGKHCMKFSKPLVWKSSDDPDQEIFQNTLQYNQTIEEFIWNHPDQWLWFHKRWKVKPSRPSK